MAHDYSPVFYVFGLPEDIDAEYELITTKKRQKPETDANLLKEIISKEHAKQLKNAAFRPSSSL